MRPVLIALAVLAAALAAGVRPGSAQFNYAYCSEGGDDNSSGDMDCSFYTMQQCREAARGIGRSCMENPRLQWERQRGGGQAQTPARRSSKQQRGY